MIQNKKISTDAHRQSMISTLLTEWKTHYLTWLKIKGQNWKPALVKILMYIIIEESGSTIKHTGRLYTVDTVLIHD